MKSVTLFQALIGVGIAVSTASAQVDYAKGKISKNFYRVPYIDGIGILMASDYVHHVNPQASDNGAMDVIGLFGGEFYIVAAADGEVIQAYDDSDDCGCHLEFSPCANSMTLRHDNGEISYYLHMERNSLDAAGTFVGKCVTAGEILAIEGDVGWTCGDGSEPRVGDCIDEVPPFAGDCYHHLHWWVARESTYERLNPMTCGPLGEINSNIYLDDGLVDAGICNSTQCSTTVQMADDDYTGYGVFKVVQADDWIEADQVTVDNYASVVLHAGNRVTLNPGFHAQANGYFRAEIGPCNVTLPSDNPTCSAGVRLAPMKAAPIIEDQSAACEISVPAQLDSSNQDEV